ncbi:MAG: alternative ribosome rescue aminoacyl-tRNA hydrolase ArfB [Actinomycetota bacterium]
MDSTDHVTPAGWRIDPAAFSWKFSRSSGPGGQHVNTTDSKAELICDLTQAGLPEHVATRVIAKLGEQVRVVASTQRSQLRNRAEAIERLCDLIDTAAKVERARRPTRPGKGAVERRITAKKHTATRKANRSWRADE